MFNDFKIDDDAYAAAHAYYCTLIGNILAGTRIKVHRNCPIFVDHAAGFMARHRLYADWLNSIRGIVYTASDSRRAKEKRFRKHATRLGEVVESMDDEVLQRVLAFPDDPFLKTLAGLVGVDPCTQSELLTNYARRLFLALSSGVSSEWPNVDPIYFSKPWAMADTIGPLAELWWQCFNKPPGTAETSPFYKMVAAIKEDSSVKNRPPAPATVRKAIQLWKPALLKKGYLRPDN